MVVSDNEFANTLPNNVWYVYNLEVDYDTTQLMRMNSYVNNVIKLNMPV